MHDMVYMKIVQSRGHLAKERVNVFLLTSSTKNILLQVAKGGFWRDLMSKNK